MKDILNRNNEIVITPRRLFYIIWICVAAASVFFLVYTHGRYVNSLIYERGKDRFMDFFNHISYVRENGMANVYQTSIHACFPPLIYFMYYFFSLILPKNATVMYLASLTSSYALLLYVWYCAAIAVLLCYTVMKMMPKVGSRNKLALTGMIITSNIFIFGVLERGNSVIIACLLLMWACMYKDSNSKIKREIALILIAMATATKIYPVVFGFLYLFEKRWKEAIRLIIYGALFFFVPFIAFGGVQGFMQFMTNLMCLQTGIFYDLRTIASVFNYIMWYTFGAESNQIIANILVVIYLILAMGGAMIHKTAWKRLCLLVSIMILCPMGSNQYTLVYLIIPLIYFFLNSDGGWLKRDFIYAFLFAVIFTLWTVEPGITNNSLSETLQYSALYILNILLIGEAVHQFLQNRSKSRKREQIRQSYSQ